MMRQLQLLYYLRLQQLQAYLQVRDYEQVQLIQKKFFMEVDFIIGGEEVSSIK